MNGKGDRPRNNWSRQFRNNFDLIKWNPKNMNDLFITEVKHVWTDILPTKEGWYWILLDNNPNIVEVKRQRGYGNRLCAFIVKWSGNFPVEEIQNALWSGPLIEPIDVHLEKYSKK